MAGCLLEMPRSRKSTTPLRALTVGLAERVVGAKVAVKKAAVKKAAKAAVKAAALAKVDRTCGSPAFPAPRGVRVAQVVAHPVPTVDSGPGSESRARRRCAGSRSSSTAS